MVEFDPVLVHEWLSRSARRFPDKEALICDGQRLTYRMLDEQTSILAAALRRMGPQRRDRVLVLLDNGAEAVISAYAIMKAGGAFVLVDGSTPARKLSYVLDNCGAKMLITHTSKAAVIAEMGKQIADCTIVWVGPSDRIPERAGALSIGWQALLDDSKSHSDIPPIRIIDVDLASLIYTSATTGNPKGITCTHHNMVSAARSIIQYIGNSEDDIILDVLPLSFDYGLYQVIMTFMFGGTIILEKSFLYVHNILRRIAEEKVTGFPIVPTIVAMLLKSDSLGKYDFSSLRYMTNTGAALPVKHIETLRSSLPWVTIFSMFGLTECKRVGYLPPEDLDRKPGSVGRAMPNCETFVLDDEGNPVAPGEIGELVIRGSNVMQCYWNDPQLSEKVYRQGAYPADRRLHSGDFFRMDEEGYLYFVSRRDDMIKSRGERISPKELEETICNMQGVTEAAVIGLPDEILGQAVKLFVVSGNGSKLTENDVLRYCRENVEARMMPRYVQIIESLPRTTNGKIDKKRLKAMEVV